MKRILFVILAIIAVTVCYNYSKKVVYKLSIDFVEKEKIKCENDFYTKLEQTSMNGSRLMYSVEYGNSSYTIMDMEAVRRIDDRKLGDMDYYSLIELLFPYGRYRYIVPTMFKCLRPGNFKGLEKLYAVKDTPWEIYMLNRVEKDKLVLFKFQPVFVGYLYVNSYMKTWRPSLDESCEDALKYIINEDKNYKGCHASENKYLVQNMLSLYNKYFYLEEDEGIDNRFNMEPIFHYAYFSYERYEGVNSLENNPFAGHQIGWIYDNYYRVYYDIYPLHTYEVDFNYYNYNHDRTDFYDRYMFIIKIGYIILMVLMSSYLVLLAIKYKTIFLNTCTKYFIPKSLKGELLLKCNPKQFMNPFNSDLVTKSNKLYAEIKNTASDDKKTLLIYRRKIISELGVAFETSSLLKKILKKSNPKKYLKPYNPDKLAIANDIYSKAIEHKEDIEFLEELLERIKKELEK